jgi:hypothetical protein
MNTKHNNMIDNAHNPTTQATFKKTELYLIYNCLEDCMNSDDWESYQEPISGTLAKIKKIVDNLN